MDLNLDAKVEKNMDEKGCITRVDAKIGAKFDINLGAKFDVKFSSKPGAKSSAKPTKICTRFSTEFSKDAKDS